MSGPRRGGFPGPFRRLARQPLRVLAIALLAVTALAAAGIQSAAASVLQATVNANWRGAYDILVTPPDGIAPIDGELPPNSLASTSEGMTLADLAKVRKVAGVDVAAPIGQILVPDMNIGQPELTIPASVIAQAKTEPQAYRATETFSTDDGLGERIVATDQFAFVVDDAAATRPAPDLSSCLNSRPSLGGSGNAQYKVDPKKYPALARALCTQDSVEGDAVSLPIPGGSPLTGGSESQPIDRPDQPVTIQLPDKLQTVTRITLVDPSAEKKLLGASGDFLDPLIGIDPSGSTATPAITKWADGSSSAYAAGFTKFYARVSGGSSPYTGEALTEVKELFAANGDNWDSYLVSLSNQASQFTYVPVIVSQQPVSNTTLKVDIESFGDAPAQTGGGSTTYDAPAAVNGTSAPGTRVGTTTGDVSAILNPFIATAKPLPWPGSTVTASSVADDHDLSDLDVIGRASPARYAVSESGGVVLSPNGYDSPLVSESSSGQAQAFPTDADAAAVGSESVYNGGAETWDGADDPSRPFPTLTVPIGSFDPTTIAKMDAASYVPLGAYGDVASTVDSGPDQGKTLQPSLTGLGLVSSRTAAIGSIYSAPLWDAASPIDAIRVRVGGISGYSAAAVQKVVGVAKAIDKLGLRATVVAGSSLTDANVTVTGYAFGTDDPAGKQTVGTLGTVTQRWSELGAASRVSLSVGTSTYVILGIGLAAAILLMGAALLVGIPARREQATVMRELGFSRARISRWYAAEESPGLAIIALVGAAALWLSGGKPVTQVTVAAAVAAVLAAGVVSVVAGSRRGGARRLRDARSRRIGARSVRGFGAGQVRVHALTAVLNGVAVLVVGLAAAGLLAAVLTGRTEAGRSALALLTLGRLLAPQLALGIAGIVCGVLLARLMRRIDLARRAEQWALLRAAGWTAGQLARAQRTEAATVAAPALVVAAVVAAAGAHWLGLSAPWLYLAVAAGAGAITAIAMAGTPRKGAPA